MAFEEMMQQFTDYARRSLHGAEQRLQERGGRQHVLDLVGQADRWAARLAAAEQGQFLADPDSPVDIEELAAWGFLWNLARENGALRT